MLPILRRYAIREIAVPSLFALLTLTFVLLIGALYELINLLLQPGIRAGQVLRVMGALLPATLALSTPMAILVGTLIGVGRMTLDRELLAMRAAGINVLWIFWPAMALAGVISLFMLWMVGVPIPRSVAAGMDEVGRLQYALVNALEPGRLYESDKLGLPDSDFVLYFADRDAETRRMERVVVKLGEIGEQKGHKERRREALERLRELDQRRDALGATTATQTSTTTLTRAPDGRWVDPDAELVLADDEAVRAQLTDEELEALDRRYGPMMIYAASGEIEPILPEEEQDRTATIILRVLNGSIHYVNPQVKSRDYTVVRFERLEKQLTTKRLTRSVYEAQTNGELRRTARDENLSDSRRRKARRELWSRHTIVLASFVFTMVGIPLSIWIRPSGKSWGIFLAILLMLVYYVQMEMGLAMVEAGHPLGPLVAFSANIVFAALGIALWWHALRS